MTDQNKAPDAEPLLQLLKDPKTGKLPAELKHRRVGRGERLIEEGTASDAMYFVETGRFRVESDEKLLAEIGPGSAIGEIAFFTGRPRTADVTAFRDASVFELARADYEALLAKRPGLAQAITAELANRLADTNRKVIYVPDPPRARTVAVMPVGGQPLPEGFAQRLADAVARYRSVRVIDGAAAAEGIGSSDFESDGATAWLNDQETKVETVLYIATPEADDWSRAAVRQADQLLLVGHAGEVPALSELEKYAFELLPPEHRRLVLLHEARSDRVRGTGAWLKSREVFMHHHVAPGEDDADVLRLARFLSGRALGMVCSGGGSFGAAQVGVYKATIEAGLQPDIYGGSSMGSAMAAGFALGLSAEEIDGRLHDIFVRSGAMNRMTIPRYGLLDHTVLDAKLRQHFEDTRIEDLWLPYFAIAADLSEDKPRVMREGPLWEAVRASTAIPGALAAFYTERGEMLVDGGCVDNVPFRTMHALKGGPNIVVNVQKAMGQRFDVRYSELPGRLGLLRRTLLPFLGKPPRAPGITSTVMRALLITQSEMLKGLKDTDMLVSPPPLDGAGFLSWDKHTMMMRIGYEHMLSELRHREKDRDPTLALIRELAAA